MPVLIRFWKGLSTFSPDEKIVRLCMPSFTLWWAPALVFDGLMWQNRETREKMLPKYLAKNLSPENSRISWCRHFILNTTIFCAGLPLGVMFKEENKRSEWNKAAVNICNVTQKRWLLCLVSKGRVVEVKLHKDVRNETALTGAGEKRM